MKGFKLIDIEYPVAREEHMCEACGWSILPGTQYQKEIWQWDNGKVASGKVHITCP